MANPGGRGNKQKKIKNPRNPFVLPARLRQAGPLRDRSEKRLKNKQQKEKEALDL
ncbi:MAG: hypothetical protein HY201_05280 [Nitrospirae bacterium]|nr:hypothetical protein [Candidatus Troglogloeales bacterium]MBI3598840.1 hypothetical protein [Candidatus Troglogloeales bacterium]